MSEYFIGVDVGTGSARAGVFDADGRLLGVAKKDLQIWKSAGGHVEQSSEDIWQAICFCTREAVKQSGVDASAVVGLGFDATCSLVVLDPQGTPLAVGASEDAARNVVVWMDHRATEQARRINETGHEVLRYVGGRISPEMETPKLLWLKENRADIYKQAGHFFDLADFLSWKATGSTVRSVCTVTCKWTYLAHEKRWDESYFEAIGLGDLARDGFRRIGTEIADIATPLAQGLTAEAAGELGLAQGTAVGASLIDAHCGGVGTFACRGPDGEDLPPETQMALIMGTSACAMTLSRDPNFVDGVWGPYYGAMIPGWWLLEGGQSAYGAALDHLLSLHPAYPDMMRKAAEESQSLPVYLEHRVLAEGLTVETAADLAQGLHVVPEFLGNRAPYADPNATAVISGLTLDASEASLLQLYVAGLCGLCYGTRQIIQAEKDKGLPIETLVVSGGAAQSALLRRILADATGMKVALPRTQEPVLLGGAIVGAVASGRAPDLQSGATQMSAIQEITVPNTASAALHQRKYEAFCLLQDADRQIRALSL